MSWDGVNPV